MLILNPLLKTGFNSSLTSSKKSSPTALRLHCNGKLKREAYLMTISYDSYDTVQHLNALYFIGVNSAHPKR